MPQEQWIWSTSEVLKSNLGAELPFTQAMMDQLDSQQWNDRDKFGIQLAVVEALVNAIRHGNKLDPNKSVRVECKISPNQFWIEIEDEGPGFNPECVPDPTAPENLERPCGRGVLLMKNYMNEIVFNECGNVVTMSKTRSADQ